MFAPTAEEPEQAQTDGAAAGINEHINDGRFAGGDKALVKFIGGCVERGDEQGDAGLRPKPGAGILPDGPAQGTPDEQAEDGVFGEVGALAHEGNEMRDGVFRQEGEKPAQERPDDAGGMLEGRGIAGRAEDERHPEKNRQPVEKKPVRFFVHAA